MFVCLPLFVIACTSQSVYYMQWIPSCRNTMVTITLIAVSNTHTQRPHMHTPTPTQHTCTPTHTTHAHTQHTCTPTHTTHAHTPHAHTHTHHMHTNAHTPHMHPHTHHTWIQCLMQPAIMEMYYSLSLNRICQLSRCTTQPLALLCNVDKMSTKHLCLFDYSTYTYTTAKPMPNRNM